MRCRLRLLIAFISLLAPPAIAYHIDNHLPVVIDTDMGLDHAVMLAMALVQDWVGGTFDASTQDAR